jgi:hypothetical protein
VVYCKINNFDGLKNASYKESQEQWEVKSRNGKIRVRKTTVADLESKYSMAIKVKDKSAGFEGNKEVEFDISADAFEALKAIADFDKVIGKDPKHINALKRRATAKTKLGDKAGAQADVKLINQLEGKPAPVKK